MRHLLQFVLLLFVHGIHAQTASQELAALQEQRDKAAAAALLPIDTKFKALLKPLLAKATRDGDAETATKITAILSPDKATPPTPPGTVEAGAGELKTVLGNSIWKCSDGTIMQDWTMQMLPNGDIDLTKPDGNSGWGAWFWELDPKNNLIFKIPGQRKPNDARLSKDLKRLTLTFSGTQTFTRMDGAK